MRSRLTRRKLSDGKLTPSSPCRRLSRARAAVAPQVQQEARPAFDYLGQRRLGRGARHQQAAPFSGVEHQLRFVARLRLPNPSFAVLTPFRVSAARRKSNGKQKATWNTPLVVDSPVAAIVAPSSAASVKRRKTEPYVEIVSSTSSNSKANKPTGREERATKRSLSVASVSSSLDGSAKKRRKKAKSGEQGE